MHPDQIKNILKHYGLKPNFTYGQNFLLDEIILEDIVDAAEVGPEDNVLEIGPGLGALTERLCKRAGFVLSVEKDDSFFPILKNIKKDNKENFRFEIGDFLEVDFQSMLPKGDYKVVANIPYYITGKILQVLLAAKRKPTTITLLTQKEVAQNIIAKPGQLSILAISVQLYGEPKLLIKVPAKSFYPAPKVDSAVLQIKLFDKPKYEIEEKKFFRIVKACFSGKRKQLHNTLTNNLNIPKERAMEILQELKIAPVARPQELTIENWIALSKKID